MGSSHHIKHSASPNLSINLHANKKVKEVMAKGGLGLVHQAYMENCALIFAIMEERNKKESVAKEILANKQGKSPYSIKNKKSNEIQNKLQRKMVC